MWIWCILSGLPWTCSFKQGDLVIDPIKIKVVQGWSIPKDKTIQIRNFQGLANYYRQFVKGFAQIAKPLTNLLKGKNNSQAIAWNEKCEQNFKVLNCLWVQEINSCWIELPHSWKWVIYYPCLKDLESLPLRKPFKIGTNHENLKYLINHATKFE